MELKVSDLTCKLAKAALYKCCTNAVIVLVIEHIPDILMATDSG